MMPGVSHVVLLNYVYAWDVVDPQALLRCYHSLPGWAEGLQQAGLEVTVVQRFHRTLQYECQGISYYFVADRLDPWPCPQYLPYRVHRQVAALQPAVVHLNGLLFPLQAKMLRFMLPPSCVLVVQNHAERPMLGWRGRLQAWGLKGVDGFLFTAREQAQAWLAGGIIRRTEDVFEVMEGSIHIPAMSKAVARAQTKITGKPIFLWVGNLDANKDPFTVLAGFTQLLADMPGARLYMVHRQANLLSQVQRTLAQTPRLSEAVTLLGQRSREELAQIYYSADYFVLGSHREGSGYALAEALSCGLVPIVTDIPSFRMMTNNGRIGGLWQAGSPQAFVEAARYVVRQPYATQSAAARAFFSERLSWSAIGRRAATIYRTLIERKHKARQQTTG